MERQEGTSDIEFNARFSSAQFHSSPTTVLKGVLNRRVVKESHRDAAYKGIPTLLPFFFSSLINVRRIDLSRFEHFPPSGSLRISRSVYYSPLNNLCIIFPSSAMHNSRLSRL